MAHTEGNSQLGVIKMPTYFSNYLILPDHMMESDVTILQSVTDQFANWFKNQTIILHSSHSEDGAKNVKK